MKKQYGADSMPETGDNVAIDFKVSREDQDAFAVRSLPIPMKPPHCSEMIAPPDSGMISPPVSGGLQAVIVVSSFE